MQIPLFTSMLLILTLPMIFVEGLEINTSTKVNIQELGTFDVNQTVFNFTF